MIDYNPIALEYAQNRRVNPKVIERLIADGKVCTSSRVLEVGCGTGNYLTAIEKTAHCFCWGCDPSSQMLSEASKQSRSLQLQQGRAEKLNYPDAYFDLVFTVDVIHHVSDQPCYFQEVLRVLKPGGRICTVTESEQAIRSRRPFAEYFPETVSVDLQRYPSITALQKMMIQSGFASTTKESIELVYERTDIQDFRDKAYSCLHLISEEAFTKGMERMEEDIKKNSISFISNYLLLWGSKGKEGDLS